MTETSTPAGTAPVCSIIPPFILEHLSRSDDPGIAARAREALAVVEHVHRARRGVQPDDSGPSLRQATPKRRRGRARSATGEAAPHRSIYDAENRTNLPGTKVRSEGEAATDDVAATEAYDGLGATWELWWREFGRDSLDGRGMELIASVHYSRDYDNAFWDGTQMVFGDGDGTIFTRFTKSLDVIGHELAHGVTEHTAGLMYQDQAGALNESMSDVFGVLVVQRSRGQSAAQADWLIGADLLAPGISGRALRDMKNPGTAYDDPQLGKDPQPAHMDDYVETRSDNGGVHINSGIPNRAFVLAAEALGGNAWETVGPVWFAVLTGDGIAADCDFETFAGLTVGAAEKLHGEKSDAAVAVRSAWEQVGVLASEAEPGGTDPDTSGDGEDGEPGGDSGDEPAPQDPAPHDPAPEDPAPQEPAPEPAPPADAAVRLTRSGGFAGRTTERYVQLSSLPDHQAEQWQSLLGSNTLQRIAARADANRAESQYRDVFCYGVYCEPVDLDVEVPEPDLPHRVKSLFDATLGLTD